MGRLILLQQRKMKEANDQIPNVLQVEVKLNRVKKVAEDIKNYVEKSLGK